MITIYGSAAVAHRKRCSGPWCASVLAHRHTANTWAKLHAGACAAATRDDPLRTAFVTALELENCKVPQNAGWNGKHASALWGAGAGRAMAALGADYSLVDTPALWAAPARARHSVHWVPCLNVNVYG